MLGCLSFRPEKVPPLFGPSSCLGFSLVDTSATCCNYICMCEYGNEMYWDCPPR